MKLETIHSKKVFLSPLDWGLGHCARLIPIIKELIDNKCEVYLGVNEEQKQFFENESLEIQLLDFAGYDFKIPEKNWEWNFLLQSPKLIKKIDLESDLLKNLHSEHGFDIVISDHRYGCRIENVTSIFLTHQLNVPGKLLKKQINSLHKKYLSQFNFIWVYDDERNVAGELSVSNEFSNTQNIGVRSRFSIDHIKKKYDALIIVSGPEPHRSNFRKLMLSRFDNSEYKIAMLGADVSGDLDRSEGNIDFVSHGSTEEMNELINSADVIISKIGYTTLMDVISLEKKAILCPTKGQGEQQYLANLHKGKAKKIMVVSEDEMSPELLGIMLSQE